jgi:hypothetical protein
MRTDLILICDGDAAFTSELAEWFECRAWTAAIANSTEEARRQLARLRNVACLFVDPQMAGAAQLGRQALVHPGPAGPPLVATLGTADPIADSICGVDADVAFYKPGDPDEMLIEIRRRLGARAGPRQEQRSARGRAAPHRPAPFPSLPLLHGSDT